MLDREQLIEIAVSVGAVLLMLVSMAVIGSSYGADNGTLTAEGGQMLVGVIIGFIFLLTAIGIGLAFLLNDPEDGLETDDNDADAQGTF